MKVSRRSFFSAIAALAPAAWIAKLKASTAQQSDVVVPTSPAPANLVPCTETWIRNNNGYAVIEKIGNLPPTVRFEERCPFHMTLFY